MPEHMHQTARDEATPLMRTRMKGAIVKVLAKARRDKQFQGRVAKPGAVKPKRFRPAGGYVSLAQTGLRKMFKTDAWGFEPRLDVAAPTPASAATDPVDMVSFAINQLGPASYRAAIFGRPVTITVDDEATAEVYRAAVEKSCAERPTNRLIRIAVKD